MTPERLTQLRTIAVDVGDWAEYPIVELADALEAAWAERDRWQRLAKAQSDSADRAGRRAEQAEAVNADWQKYVTGLHLDRYHWRERAERAEAAVAQLTFDYQRDPRTAALARVRALLDSETLDEAAYDFTAREIRAAIEGPE